MKQLKVLIDRWRLRRRMWAYDHGLALASEHQTPSDKVLTVYNPLPVLDGEVPGIDGKVWSLSNPGSRAAFKLAQNATFVIPPAER